MDVYLFIGTHMPEISRCMDHLIKFSTDLDPVEVQVPEGLQWDSNCDRYQVKSYDPHTALQVMDPDSAGTCFILVDPRMPLIEQLEDLATQLGNCLIEPVKILACVDCQQAENNTKLKGWLDAAIYYSDIVLLGNRTEASKSFVRDFQKHYERLCYPCLFMFLKGQGVPDDPVEILTPGTRRISQMFDLVQDENTPQVPGLVIEASCDLDLEEMETDPFRHAEPDASRNPVPDASGYVVYPS